jgi:hypothetical protein
MQIALPQVAADSARCDEPSAYNLTSVFYNLADKLAVLDIAPDLLWQRVLGVVVLGRQVDVHATALACEDFSC